MALVGGKIQIRTIYHLLLTGGYGDYMKLPPMEQRATHHHFKAWYAE